MRSGGELNQPFDYSSPALPLPNGGALFRRVDLFVTDPSFQREPLAHFHIVSAPQLAVYREEFIRTMESTALALLVGLAAAVVAVMVLTGNWLEQRARRRWSHLEGKTEDGP